VPQAVKLLDDDVHESASSPASRAADRANALAASACAAFLSSPLIVLSKRLKLTRNVLVRHCLGRPEYGPCRVVQDRTFYVEVKSTEGDSDSFKMGSSEIRLALELAKRRRRIKETYLILHISNVLTPTPWFRLLPNPYDERNSSLFTIEEADARISYRPKSQ